MGLSNALFTGLSGLDVSQAKLNVVGNNIANVNTVAFKSSRVLFKPQFYVTDSGGTQPSAESGGTNPDQRGLGAVVASIDRNLSPGSIETTGRDTDMAIDGDGYFIVKSDQQRYTRDGSFHLNQQKQLVTAGGDFVQGYGIDQDFNIVSGQLSNITIPLGSLTTAQATTQASLKGTLNAAGPVASGATILTTQPMSLVGGGTPDGTTLLTNIASAADPATPLFVAGDSFTLSGTKGDGHPLKDATFTVTAGSTLDELMQFFQENLGINTTVPDDGNPATPAPGITLEPDSGGSPNRQLVIAGNLGEENALAITFVGPGNQTPLDFNESTSPGGTAVGESARTTAIVYDSLGTPVTLNITAVLESKASTGITWRFFVESPDTTLGDQALGTGTLVFDGYGNLVESTGTRVSIPRDGTGAITPLTLDLDVSRVMCLTNSTAGRSQLTLSKDDGFPIGTLTSFSIGENGIISGNFSNGTTRTLGQVAVATFSNPQGLVDEGGNLYAEGPSSGSAVITTPTSLGAGKIKARSLEMSNVDLSEEFINLIIASTGFSAASRVISTSDQLVQELLNTSR